MINLIHGDCIEVMRGIPDSSIDAVITDLPYGTTQCAWDSVIDLDLMWVELKRITKDSSPIVMTAQTPFDKVLGCSNLPMLRYEWIWEKGNATGFYNAKLMPLKAHENILVFYKRLPTYNPQITKGHKKQTATRKTIKSECYGKSVSMPSYCSTNRYPRSVQFFSSDKQRLNYHPTQKPVALGEYLIKTYTNEGDTVLDITCSSGSFGVAAIKLNRKYIGIDNGKCEKKGPFKDVKWVDVTKHRIESEA